MINIIMAETIWNGAVTVFDFIMDNLVIINVLLSLVIVVFSEKVSADGMDMAASALFLYRSWGLSCILSSDRTSTKAGCLKRKRLREK